MLSGGKDGQLRSWSMNAYNPESKPQILKTVKEHSGAIVSLVVTDDEVEAVTASRDGSCIIWNISK